MELLFCSHFQYIHENVKVQIPRLDWLVPNVNPQKLFQNDCLRIGLNCLWLLYKFLKKTITLCEDPSMQGPHNARTC